MKGKAGLGGFIGFIFGAIVGYLLRPSAFLIGQLSFEHVISRGATLKGLDQMLKPLAETSNNYMLAGGVIFGIIGVFICKKR